MPDSGETEMTSEDPVGKARLKHKKEKIHLSGFCGEWCLLSEPLQKMARLSTLKMNAVICP